MENSKNEVDLYTLLHELNTKIEEVNKLLSSIYKTNKQHTKQRNINKSYGTKRERESTSKRPPHI
jgi:phage shock protein A